jgi:hypothetical protein
MSFELTTPPLAACTSKIYRPEGDTTGLRRVNNDVSRVAVWACPMPQVTRIALDRAVGAAGYILANHDTVYVGETKNGFSRPNSSNRWSLFTLLARQRHSAGLPKSGHRAAPVTAVQSESVITVH